jgi:AcrR family transcriptional regulator
MALLDEGGPTALSVRAVAGRLGVRPNALYTYVSDRQALERAVVERVLAEADVALLEGPAGSWRSRLSGYAVALRVVLLRHPGAVPLFMTAPMDGPTALMVGERLIATLVSAGLDAVDASRATYLLIVQVLGSVALEVAETDGRPPLPPEGQRVAERREALSQVPAEAFPWTAATVDTAASWISTAQFLWQVELLLDGLAERINP